MTPERIETNKRYWCWWMSRIVFYTGRRQKDWTDGELCWVFEDITGHRFLFGEDEINELEDYDARKKQPADR